MRPDLDHRHAGAVGQHHGHLQDDLELVPDAVGGEVVERLGAVAGLEEEGLAGGHLGQAAVQAPGLAGEDQRGQRGQRLQGWFERVLVGPFRLLGRPAGPASCIGVQVVPCHQRGRRGVGKRLADPAARLRVANANIASGPVMGERIGVFGGTFDPIHVGHLVAAVNARHALDLDRVILMVANVPWQKAGQRAVSSAEDRFALVQAAVGDVPGWRPAAGDRPGRRVLHRRHPRSSARRRTRRPSCFWSWAGTWPMSWPPGSATRRCSALATLVVVNRPGAGRPPVWTARAGGWRR